MQFVGDMAADDVPGEQPWDGPADRADPGPVVPPPRRPPPGEPSAGEPSAGEPAHRDLDAHEPSPDPAVPDPAVPVAPDPVLPVPLPRAPHRMDAELDELAPRARDGDLRALERLLSLVRPYVLAYCRGRLGRGRVGLSGAEDVAQEVLLGVCKGLARFENARSPFMAFVYGIAANKVADAYRAARRGRTIATGELPEGVDDRDGPENYALRGDACRHISALLDRLPPANREILVLRIGLRFSAEETAAMVGMTAGAVRVAQHRALNKLRTWIADEDQ